MNDYERVRLGGFVNESSTGRKSEIEIQARLFAGEYGMRWETTCGPSVEVVHFGQWNREAGPDFKGARLRFGDGEESAGDIEVDMDARDWERHGHATNPAYCGVRLQLFVHQTSGKCRRPTSRSNRNRLRRSAMFPDRWTSKPRW